jgi:hypothetical protein
VGKEEEAGLGSHRLRSLSIIGGFLDGERFDLADGLNCIIGARGTGKITVLEFVRYAMDALAKDRALLLTFYDIQAEHWEHIRTTNTLGSTFATVRQRTRRTTA